jgi:hypothetical protein
VSVSVKSFLSDLGIFSQCLIGVTLSSVARPRSRRVTMHSYYAWITDYVLTRSILADMPELEKMYDKVSTFKQADDR